MVDVVGHLILGSVFTVYGLSILIRQSARIGIGGGRTAGSPVFVTEVTGFTARIFGSVVVFSGLLVVTPFILTLIGTTVSPDLMFWLPFMGIVIIVIGLFFCAIIQSAVLAGERLNTNKAKSKNDHSPDADWS